MMTECIHYIYFRMKNLKIKFVRYLNKVLQLDMMSESFSETKHVRVACGENLKQLADAEAP